MARETNKNRERKEEGEPRRFSFSLSMAGLVSLTVVGVAALAWVFILGVLVGRGYKPEQAVPQLAEIMPRPSENATVRPPVEDVLRPEELEFFDAVRKKPGVASRTDSTPKARTDARADAKAKAKASAVADAVAKPDAKAKVAPKAAPPRSHETKSASQSAASAPQDDASAKRFRYVYQAAALRNAAMARDFAARLQKLGVSTSIEKAATGSGVWHRVLVHHTGTPESTRVIKDTLKKAGVDKPLMKSKSPI